MKQPLSLVHRSQTPSFKLPEQNNKQNTVASAKMLPNCIEKKRKLRFLNPPPPPPPLAARLSKLLPLAQKLETLENLILKQKQRHLNDHNDQGFHNFTDSKSDCRNTIITATINPPLLLLECIRQAEEENFSSSSFLFSSPKNFQNDRMENT
jgi:hypothetical protein